MQKLWKEIVQRTSKMRLVTHNFLTSNFLRGVKNGYPLTLVADQIELIDVKIDKEKQNLAIVDKLDWSVFKAAAEACNVRDLPEERPTVEAMANDEELYKKMHHVLLELDVISGKLICPETGREFVIRDGVVNMLAREDELPPRRHSSKHEESERKVSGRGSAGVGEEMEQLQQLDEGNAEAVTESGVINDGDEKR